MKIVLKNIAIFLFFLFLSSNSAFGQDLFEIDKNLVKVSIQNKKILIEEDVKLIKVASDSSGINWTLIGDENNKTKVLSAFSDKKVLIPHRSNKEGNLLIGDLNRKNKENVSFNIKYLIKNSDNHSVLNSNNKLLKIATNQRVNSLTCDDRKIEVNNNINEEIELMCMNKIEIKTRSININYLEIIKNWILNLK